MKKLNQTLLALGLALVSGVSLMAATSTWTNVPVDALWITSGNWVAGAAPAASDDIEFPASAGQNVDLGAGTYGIGSLLFNSSSAYSIGNGTLTLGGNLTQSGTGTVAVNSTTDIGNANRTFNGSSGTVSFNGPITDVANAAGTAKQVVLNGGNWVITNSANTVDQFTASAGAVLTVTGSGVSTPDYPGSWYLGGNGTAGGFYGSVDGGTLKVEATQPQSQWFGAAVTPINVLVDWSDRGFVFGPAGGTLELISAPSVSSPTVWYGNGGTQRVVVGQPLPYTGDPWAPNVGAASDGTNQCRSPFETEYGVALGIFQSSSFTYGTAPFYYKWRQGSGDFEVVVTNGGCAYLDWNALTNGNLIIRGHPGGDSAVAETNLAGTGWSQNVGRFAIRGPHRAGAQYGTSPAPADPNYPSGAVNRSFTIPAYNGNGMVFYDAVQVWNRDGLERLASDMTFKSGSSVDFCSSRRVNGLDLGHIASTLIGGLTNKMTIESGASCNLNLQLRTTQADGRNNFRTATNGVPILGGNGGMRVFANIDIQDGGQLKIYRSQTNCFGKDEIQAGMYDGTAGKAATKCIELFRPIAGNGTTAADSRLVVDLPFSPGSDSGKDSFNNNGKDGVSWTANPNAGSAGNFPGSFPIVNGTGDYGLRVVGKAAYLTNYLYAVRIYPNSLAQPAQALTGLTGAGGTLTLAVNDNDTLPINNGPVSASAVKLGLDSESGSSPTFVLGTDASMANYAGLVLKGGTASVNDSSTVTMATLKLGGSATINLGTGVGGSVLNFNNSSAVAWNAGTLTITSWNGAAAGGGSDQIKVGTDATGLTPAQRAQIKWINPYGSGDVTTTIQLSSGEIVPAAQPSIGSPAPSLIGGQLVFGVAPGNPGATTIVQCATNLTPPVVWSNEATNSGAFNYTNSTALPQSYYRLLVQ